MDPNTSSTVVLSALNANHCSSSISLYSLRIWTDLAPSLLWMHETLWALVLFSSFFFRSLKLPPLVSHLELQSYMPGCVPRSMPPTREPCVSVSVCVCVCECVSECVYSQTHLKHVIGMNDPTFLSILLFVFCTRSVY